MSEKIEYDPIGVQRRFDSLMGRPDIAIRKMIARGFVSYLTDTPRGELRSLSREDRKMAARTFAEVLNEVGWMGIGNFVNETIELRRLTSLKSRE